MVGAEGLKRTQEYPAGPEPQSTRASSSPGLQARLGESVLAWWQQKKHTTAEIGNLVCTDSVRRDGLVGT